MTRGKIRFLYVLYIVAVTIFFVYRLFPDRAVRNYLSARLKTALPQIDLTAVRAKPAFPPGLKLEKMSISYKSMPLVDLAELTITPAARSLLRPGYAFRFSGSLYGGTIKGRLDWIPKSPHHAVAVHSTLDGIQLGASPALARMAGRKISGTLSGTVQFEGDSAKSGAAAAELTVSDSRVEVLASALGVEQLAFKNISADLSAQGRNIRIQNCTLRGDQIDGRFSGTLEMMDPVVKSRLNLTGAIRPHHQFLADLKKRLPVNLLAKKRADNNEFPIRFSGTIDSPAFAMD